MSDDALGSALRTVTHARLVALGIPAFVVGRWCRAWELEAARRGSMPRAASWEDGIRWIVAQVAEGRPPPKE